MTVDADLADFLKEYERRTNTHRFENVSPLIAEMQSTGLPMARTAGGMPSERLSSVLGL